MKSGGMQYLKEIIAWILALLILIPFYLVIVNALKTDGESLTMSFALPEVIVLENFATVWNIDNINGSFFDSYILRAYRNSALLTLSTTFLSLTVTAPCAYVLSRRRSKFNRAVYLYFAAGLMVPLNMVTVVKVLRILGLYNSYIGTILLFTALVLPLSIFLFYGFISSIPRELDQAAIVDGAGAYRIFFTIIFPTLKPVTVTVVMINFLNVWNDYIVPLYVLPDPGKGVILQQVYKFYGQFSAQWNLVSVVILYAVIPILLVYLIGQRYIISGMTAGAVKG